MHQATQTPEALDIARAPACLDASMRERLTTKLAKLRQVEQLSHAEQERLLERLFKAASDYLSAQPSKFVSGSRTRGRPQDKRTQQLLINCADTWEHVTRKRTGISPGGTVETLATLIADECLSAKYATDALATLLAPPMMREDWGRQIRNARKVRNAGQTSKRVTNKSF